MFTPTTHNPHNIRRTLIHGAVLVSLFSSLLFVPVMAEARTVPGGPSKDYPFCFSTTEGAAAGEVSIALSYCYANLGACEGAVGSHSDIIVPCHDAYAAMSKYEKTVQEKGPVAALGEKAVEAVTGGAVGLLGTALEFIGKIGAEMSGKLMMAMASVLDIAIDRTINYATYSNLTAVNVG